MYLSRVEINPYRRETMRALESPQIIHAAVMASFDSFGSNESDRVLWRVDSLRNATYILIQSQRRPDMHHIVDQFGRPDSEHPCHETQEYDQFLQSIKAGERMMFRLTANPTHSIKDPDNPKRGKVVAHVTINQQKKWLSDRAPKYGFEFVKDGEDPMFDVRSRKNFEFKRGDSTVTLNAATFEGLIEVTDSEKMISAMKEGIGRGKAYGCGLLTVMRV